MSEILLMPPKRPPKYNSDIQEIFPKPTKSGEIGIEIEVEGSGLPIKIPSYWSTKNEPSLRGESKEYILTKPVKRTSIHNMLQYFSKKFEESGAKWSDSQRASVHVHINCQGLSMRQIYTFICLYLVFEDLLTEWAGESRTGNLFCLRAKDAEYFITQLVNAAKRDEYSIFLDEHRMRYTSINTCALWKFNSLEFRALRSTVDPDIIETWVKFLIAIKDASIGYKEPREIIQAFSRMGAVPFMESVFTPNEIKSLTLPKYIKDPHLLQRTLWDSVRLIQEIAYAINWKLPDKNLRKKVFGVKVPPIEPEFNPFNIAQPILRGE